jgi:hypothetical protein
MLWHCYLATLNDKLQEFEAAGIKVAAVSADSREKAETVGSLPMQHCAVPTSSFSYGGLGHALTACCPIAR